LAWRVQSMQCSSPTLRRCASTSRVQRMPLRTPPRTIGGEQRG
jgi:hypothetical protein